MIWQKKQSELTKLLIKSFGRRKTFIVFVKRLKQRFFGGAPVHGYLAVGLTDYINDMVNELYYDDIAMVAIVTSFREDFGLSGADLRNASKLAIIRLLENGAVPGKKSNNRVQPAITGTYEEIADSILVDWNMMGRDVDDWGLWFSRPRIEGVQPPAKLNPNMVIIKKN